jgi:hypothetical protein
MKLLALILFLISLAAAASVTPPTTRTFTGVITDSMCLGDHSMMKATNVEQCVRDCVRAGYKYVLYDGKTAYKLSDQAAPEKFAGKRVVIHGVLYEKTGVIKVESIEAAK